MGVLDLHQHLRAHVLHGLRRADWLAKLLPNLGVLDTHLQRLAGGAEHLSRRAHTSPLEHRLEWLPALVEPSDDRVSPNTDVVKLYRAGPTGLVDAFVRRNGQTGRVTFD